MYEWADGGGKVQWLADSRGRGPRTITRKVEPGTQYVHSDWSPDGRSMAFEALSGDGPASVWLADADGTNAVEKVTCKTERCLQMSYPAFSPDGSKLLVVQYDQLPNEDWASSHLVVIDLQSGKRKEITRTPNGKSAFYSPRWSPDGKSVVVQLETYPDATENEIAGSVIARVKATGAGLHKPVMLTDPAMFAGHPNWHPSKDLIVFDTYDLSAFQVTRELSNLYTMDPKGKNQQQLTKLTKDDGIRVGEPSWTPDGTSIIAAVGIVAGGALSSAELSYVDPATGDLDRLDVVGANPHLEPV